ncbi:UNVERIFIED_CONTAM: hypothetical protein PYX00_007163 [Menopon gallinae]|uniref:Cytochrome c oxidase assembly protein COX15 homolog n=1 Tax=Menopon gallinae TaxID=328185 RepID=A0AAW2HIQ2_9NEOP
MFSLTCLNRSRPIFNSFRRLQLLNTQHHAPVKVRQVYSAVRVPVTNTSKILRSLSIYKTFVRNKASQVIQQPKKIVGYWLLGCSGMVIVAVVLGGVTRLTESGLSMVTWRLLGEKMPWTNEDWIEEFEKYKQYPEYKQLKRDITLEEFKWIWRMEFIHRTWGRFIGAAFYIPAVFFWMRGYLTSAYKKRVVILGTLIAMQGLLGWYMVKSGLEDRFHEPSDIPRVSQYRLAAHLGLAFTLYTAMLYSSLGILLPLKYISIPENAKYLKRIAHLSKGLIFLTALSGAFVAGLDAGLVYNSFPKMGDRWIPDDLMAMKPNMANFTENPTTVQFDHRLLGICTLAVISGLWLASRRHPLPPRARKAINALACMGIVQVLLGISTLVHFVPTPLAATHQSGSLVLLSFAVWLTHELKYLKYVPK